MTMNFTLKPDENGVIVILKDVDDADVNALEKADKSAFDPTDAPFDKYYAYDPRIGFFVGKDHFDHAEHKGKRLSFTDYMNLISEGEIIVADDAITAVDCIHKAVDSKFDVDFIISRLLDVQKPKDVNSATVAISNCNFALAKLLESIDDATDAQKPLLHKAIEHAFDVYEKAANVLSSTNFVQLLELSEKIDDFNDASAKAQAALLSKYNENF